MKFLTLLVLFVIPSVVLFRVLRVEGQDGSSAGPVSRQASASTQGFDTSESEHVELGTVQWHRDFDQAVQLARQTEKPLAILFQEVPGCAGCQKYGRQVLSHPLIVEALEENFVPTAVFNNVGGRDRQILTQFEEPAWNYQVMRFTDGNLKELIPRRDQVWTVPATASRLAKALEVNGRPVPSYLTDVVLAEANPDLQTAVFAMFCFWTGEAKLGALDGVTSTEAGFFDGREVVVVRYNPKEIDLVSLTRKAAEIDCAHAVYLPDAEAIAKVSGATRLAKVAQFDQSRYRRAPERDQKRQLMSARGLDKLQLTPMQWTKLNSTVISRDPFGRWLSPRQLAQLNSTN